MDYGYSPIQHTNNVQRIIKPIKVIKPLCGKRLIKYDVTNKKILRTKKF